ncbi:GerMN domain-containing protein [Cohnella cholangitidis]|uniref:GerMN domain-containing protein n=1 Tax=Cohnella cholangitidis TaxID=2598458 RepID=A0A7G5C3I4_9BACL|nr:GerMN domain-containing protein [Cohnella cholangitidis]QMV43768.1 hypothetical protein FPL14_23290 [Cohnella cholangitidis]
MKTMSYRSRSVRRWGGLLLLLPLLSACSLGTPADQGADARIDPPPSAVEQAMLQETSAATFSEANEVVTVYLLDRNGYLAPMSLRLDGGAANSRTSARKAIDWLIVNPQLKDQLPQGFKAVLPEGTQVKSVSENQTEETITVDFAAPFPSIEAAQERKVIEALVWTLTELPGINKVKLSVAGKPIKSLPSSGLPVDTVLTRGLGINLQTSKDVQLSRAMGVTLYFSSQTKDGEGYFVPVTRLIHRQSDAAKARWSSSFSDPKIPRIFMRSSLRT